VVLLAGIQAKRGEALGAVREYRRGLTIVWGARCGRPQSDCRADGQGRDVLVTLARRDRSSNRWREARQQYERALAGWDQVTASAALTPADAGRPQAIEQKTADCDAALAGLGGGAPW